MEQGQENNTQYRLVNETFHTEVPQKGWSFICRKGHITNMGRRGTHKVRAGPTRMTKRRAQYLSKPGGTMRDQEKADDS